MNVYAAVILVTLLVDYVLTLAADALNLRSLRGDLPEEFHGVYDDGAYRRSQEYTRARTRFGFVARSFDLAVLLAFWWSGGFAWLDDLLRALQWGNLATGLAFIGLLVLAKGLLDLPFRLWSTFVIEERFGFNRTTPWVFAVDLAKGLGLAIVLGAPLLAALLLFFEKAGALAWLYGWLLTTAFLVIVQLVFPTWILPLFNKFEPLPEGELREAIAGYARSVDFALGGVFVIDGSRRSTHANAFFAGIGRTKRIALFDTLVDKHTVAELVAILAHEIGHYKKRHVLKNLVLGIVHSGVMFYLLSVFLGHEGLFAAFFMERSSVWAGLVFFGMLYAPIELVLMIGLQFLSRRDEFEADRFAARTCDPEDMIAALKKVSASSLVNLTPHPFYVFLNHSHPPMLERIAAIRLAAD